jgi:S-formylglutathione hydrolase
MTLERINRVKAFDGWLETWQHTSTATATSMRFAIYLPPQAEAGPVPHLYWLSGLTCTEENFMVKAGALRDAARLGIALIAPDTSPRGANIPGEDESWDFGSGAGFYVDATQEPWSGHYRMYDYIVNELPALVEQQFPVKGKPGISGHSMGGHGALVIALRNPGRYASVSAFAPICAPTECPWGHKAFGNYLGPDTESWKAYDAHLLLQQVSEKFPILVDQGSEDNFLHQQQLRPDLLGAAAAKVDWPLTLRMQPGYDHGYYFVSSLIAEHLDWHVQQGLGQ